MAVPRAVQKAADDADAAHAEAYPKPVAPEPTAPPPEAAPNAEAPPAAPDATTGSPPTPSPSPPAETPPTTEETLEQRFATLQGKYNAEVRDAQRRARDEAARSARLETLVATMQLAKPAPAVAAPTATPAPTNEELLSAEDIETYGEEFLNVVRKAARAEARNIVSERIAPIETKVGSVETVVTATVQERKLDAQRAMVDRLTELVPDWPSLNTDQGFLDWLASVDPFAGRPRQAMFDEAANAGNGDRLANFFRAYQQEHAAVRPSAADPDTRAPAPSPATPLQTFVAPGRGRPSAAPSAPGNKRVWTTDDIQRFYRDKAQGKYPAKEAEALERDIFNAPLEGRYTP